MAASLTETMTLPAIDSLRLKPVPPSTPSALFRPIATSDARVSLPSKAGSTLNTSRVRVDPQHALQPARKKLSTLEAQRVMAALTAAIRRAELASALPYLVSETQEEGRDRSIALGADLTRLMNEHRVLLDSCSELREAEKRCQRRTDSAQSSQRRADSVSQSRSQSVHSSPKSRAESAQQSQRGAESLHEDENQHRANTEHGAGQEAESQHESRSQQGADSEHRADNDAESQHEANGAVASRKGSASSKHEDQSRQSPVLAGEDEEKNQDQGPSDEDEEQGHISNRDECESDRKTPEAISLQAASRNLALVERRLQDSTRNILRAFAMNPTAGDSILKSVDASSLRSEPAEDLIQQLKGLRDFLMSRMLTTPVEDVERSRYLREVAEKERYNSGIIAKLTAELQAAEELRDTNIAKQNNIIRRLQAELHQVEKASDENVHRTRSEAEKQEAADQKNCESKLTKQQQDLGLVRTQYSSLLAQHRDSEQALRKRKFQVETEVENWIQKFDGDMGERQDEFEQIDEVYTEEKRQLNELEERFKTLEVEYDRIMEERRIARETREAAERELQTCIRAALTIQAFWRSFKVRKAIKAKKKKGGGKGAGVKKGKK